MDLYLFYNCFNNLKEIYETPENKLTLRHQYLFNNPLLLSEYFDRTKFQPIVIDSFVYEQDGGVLKPPKMPKPPKIPKPPGDDAPKEISENDVKSEVDSGADEDELEGIKKIIKKFMKIIIGIIVVISIPIVPWILISFYAFKNLGDFLEINMNRL